MIIIIIYMYIVILYFKQITHTDDLPLNGYPASSKIIQQLCTLLVQNVSPLFLWTNKIIIVVIFITLAPEEECDGNAFRYVCISVRLTVSLSGCVTKKMSLRLT